MTQPPYQPQQPFDPTRPLGPQRPETTHIEQFTPPRSPLPWLIMVAAVVIAGLILFTTTLTNRPPAPSASPTPSATSTAAASGHAFVSPDGAEGTWEVLESRWNDEGVEINLRLSVDKGTLGYSFMAFSNDAVEVLEPGPAMSSPALDWQPIEAGQERTGWIYFPSYRADLTLLLTTELGRQISAQLIPA